MKKIIAWLTKGSKVVRILNYIYNGLFVATKALNSAINALVDVEPGKNDKVISLLTNVLEYSDIAMQAVQKIIEWLGIEPKLDSTVISVEEERGSNVISHGARLADITGNIKGELARK